MTTSAWARHSAARSVNSPGLPGPAPTRKTRGKESSPEKVSAWWRGTPADMVVPAEITAKPDRESRSWRDGVGLEVILAVVQQANKFAPRLRALGTQICSIAFLGVLLSSLCAFARDKRFRAKAQTEDRSTQS